MIALVVFLGAFSVGCWQSEEPPPESGDIDFVEPEDIPEEVKEWTDSMEEAVRDWMVVDDTVYVAVTRGEVPNSGYGVVIENMTYSKDEEGFEITVSASYTAPDESRDYSEETSYPVALASFSLNDLPEVAVEDLEFDFVVDESKAVVEEEGEKSDHTVTLYFGTDEGNMVRVYRTVRAEEKDADLVVGELMAGPVEPAAQEVLPEDTRITAVADSDDPTLVLIDFSSEILDAKGTLGEMLAVYSVINSLLDNDLGFTRAKISVEGESRELGHLDISEPLEYDDSLVISEK
ncbi:MAG: GerMN domain-containing protein [Clostridia bacterium]